VYETEHGKKVLDILSAQALQNYATEKTAAPVPGDGDQNDGDQIAGDQPGDDLSANGQPSGNKPDQTTNNQTAGNRTTFSKPNGNEAIATVNDQQQKNKNNRSNDSQGSNKKFTRTNKGKTKVNIVVPNPFDGSQVGEESLTAKNKPISSKTTGKTNVKITSPDPFENLEEESYAQDQNKETAKVEAKVKEEPAKETTKVKKDEKEKEPTVTENKSTASTDKKKTEKKFPSNFGLTFSAGPDASFVSLKRFGKINLTYGAGIRYDFAKKLTVRTGFYVTKKIYTASPEQYHTPGGNYPHLVGVDANCKIYEIPLSLAYSFGHKKNHNWFANVGLSSFIMKTEDYTYNYKNYNQAYSYYQKVSNENKHYFSVLTISGGYNYRFNKRVSIQAEPYLQLPLSGIGNGKIKLNSAGVLFTVNIKPFAKKK
jgi:hypothetical protein